jgi:hypothetical protein
MNGSFGAEGNKNAQETRQGLFFCAKVGCCKGKLYSGSDVLIHFIRTYVLACLILLYAPAVFAGVAPAIPPTCDTNFWDVLRARAWEEANREITQNQNLIAKPDSVLQYICFDSYMEHLARYSENGGPEDPDGTGGIFYDLYVLLRRIPGSIDPALTDGLDMNSVLEILIFDSLEDGVSALSIADAGGATAAVCGRDHYLEANFDHNMLGGRSGISGDLGSSIGDNAYSCNRMRQVWEAAKCYNFQTRAHDGFFNFDQYRAREAADRDYRELPTECTNLDTDLAHVICNYIIHGTPPNILGSAGWPWVGGAPTAWSTAFPAANPAPGAAGGADSTLSYFNLLDPTACAALTPVKTGLIVTRPNSGTSYTDAVCTAPGCWYQPGGGVAAAGTCNP